MKVERVFTRAVVGVSRRDSVEEAAVSMRRFHVGALIVVEPGESAPPRVAGIVTDRDLVLLVLAERLDASKVAVETIMTPVVASVAEGDDILEALARMRKAGARRLLVTDARGNPAGILSLDDILDGVAAELGTAAALLKEEVERERDGHDVRPA